MKHYLIYILTLITNLSFGQISADTTGIPIGQIIFTKSNCIAKQNIDKSLIDTGEFKNYFRYDLGDCYFYNGRFENNLSYKIQQKDNGTIVYTR